jgi:hypothetical protein
MKAKVLAGVLSALILALVIPLIGAAQNKAPQNWTTKDLKQAIAAAKTAADHKNIALYYTNDAARLEAESKDHAEVGQTYHEHAPRRAAQAEAYCRMLASEYSDMAQTERELAKLHEDLAKP